MAPKAASIQSQSWAIALLIAALLVAIATITAVGIGVTQTPTPGGSPPTPTRDWLDPVHRRARLLLPRVHLDPVGGRCADRRPGHTSTPTAALAAAADSSYRTQVGSSQAKGILVIGYVHTTYGTRSLGHGQGRHRQTLCVVRGERDLLR